MSDKNTVSMTMALNERENDVLEQLAQENELSKVAVMRSALRLYQQVHVRLKKGEHMAFVDKDGNVIKQAVFGCGH